jgi:hypothetical protein
MLMVLCVTDALPAVVPCSWLVWKVFLMISYKHLLVFRSDDKAYFFVIVDCRVWVQTSANKCLLEQFSLPFFHLADAIMTALAGLQSLAALQTLELSLCVKAGVKFQGMPSLATLTALHTLQLIDCWSL